ncbi:pollen receptor-like kinase 2 [Rosa sericea]
MKRSKMSRCSMRMRRSVHWTLFPQCSLILLLLFHINVASSAAPPPDPADTLLKFKDSLKISGNALSNWVKTTHPCDGRKANWDGVLCGEGKIWGLQLEKMGLSGHIDVTALTQLPDLRTISMMQNNFEGSLPDWRKLSALKTLYMSENKFSGEIPSDLFQGMKQLKKLHLANNQFTGQIPKSLTTLDKLVELTLQGNKFSGKIPDFPQVRWTVFNASKNDLEGEIPDGLRKLSADSFAGNKDLCGAPLHACSAPSSHVNTEKPTGVSTSLIVIMIVIAVISIGAAIFFVIVRRRNKRSEYLSSNIEAPPASSVQNRSVSPVPKEPDQVSQTSEHSSKGAEGGGGSSGKKADSLKLSFVRDDRERFDMQDLLKASAEVLGSGSFGSSYKAALLTGPVMVVKRYKQMNNVGREEFQEHMRRIGRLGHPNLLPLVAYYYKKEEKLLITDHVPNGSLAVRLHGHQSLGQPSLDWPTRLKIVKGVAQGLKYLYSELPSVITPHGHLKSSNVLLSKSFEPLITDYGLIPVVNQEHAHTLMVAYKSPEYVATKRITKKTDVWSLGVLILEILTGKLPTNFLQHGKGSEEDLASWVNSVPREEWFTQVFDREMGANKNCEGEMLKLLNIGLDCCEGDVEKRWDMKEAVERIEELKEKENGGGGSGGGPNEDFMSSCASEGDTTKMV